MGLLSLFLPYLGLIFTIAYSGRIWNQPAVRQIVAWLVFTAVILVLAIWQNNLPVWINACDAAIGVGLGTAVFVFILKRSLDFNLALAWLLGLEIAYHLLRALVFGSGLAEISTQTAPDIQRWLQLSPQMTQRVMDLWLNYQPALFGAAQITGVYFGCLLFNLTSPFKHRLRQVRFPYPLVLMVIAALALSLYPLTHLGGINLLILLVMVYLIQGAGVLSYFWGDFFARARLLRALFILAVIVNLYLLLLIALTGVLDVWFDFRKFNKMEETNESDPD